MANMINKNFVAEVNFGEKTNTQSSKSGNITQTTSSTTKTTSKPPLPSSNNNTNSNSGNSSSLPLSSLNNGTSAVKLDDGSVVRDKPSISMSGYNSKTVNTGTNTFVLDNINGSSDNELPPLEKIVAPNAPVNYTNSVNYSKSSFVMGDSASKITAKNAADDYLTKKNDFFGFKADAFGMINSLENLSFAIEKLQSAETKFSNLMDPNIRNNLGFNEVFSSLLSNLNKLYDDIDKVKTYLIRNDREFASSYVTLTTINSLLFSDGEVRYSKNSDYDYILGMINILESREEDLTDEDIKTLENFKLQRDLFDYYFKMCGESGEEYVRDYAEFLVIQYRLTGNVYIDSFISDTTFRVSEYYEVYEDTIRNVVMDLYEYSVKLKTLNDFEESLSSGEKVKDKVQTKIDLLNDIISFKEKMQKEYKIFKNFNFQFSSPRQSIYDFFALTDLEKNFSQMNDAEKKAAIFNGNLTSIFANGGISRAGEVCFGDRCEIWLGRFFENFMPGLSGSSEDYYASVAKNSSNDNIEYFYTETLAGQYANYFSTLKFDSPMVATISSVEQMIATIAYHAFVGKFLGGSIGAAFDGFVNGVTLGKFELDINSESKDYDELAKFGYVFSKGILEAATAYGYFNISSSFTSIGKLFSHPSFSSTFHFSLNNLKKMSFRNFLDFLGKNLNWVDLGAGVVGGIAESTSDYLSDSLSDKDYVEHFKEYVLSMLHKGGSAAAINFIGQLIGSIIIAGNCPSLVEMSNNMSRKEWQAFLKSAGPDFMEKYQRANERNKYCEIENYISNLDKGDLFSQEFDDIIAKYTTYDDFGEIINCDVDGLFGELSRCGINVNITEFNSLMEQNFNLEYFELLFSSLPDSNIVDDYKTVLNGDQDLSCLLYDLFTRL